MPPHLPLHLARYTRHPTPYSTPCTLYPTPCTRHPTTYTLHPTPYTLPYTVHAGESHGFCLLSNAAIGAAHALAVRGRDKGVERVAIIDWDVHHGNGTGLP